MCLKSDYDSRAISVLPPRINVIIIHYLIDYRLALHCEYLRSEVSTILPHLGNTKALKSWHINTVINRIITVTFVFTALENMHL